MESLVRTARRGGVILIAGMSIVASLVLVYTLFNGGSVARLPTVLQMTSTVSATLRDGVTTVDVFDALFPCGSVTGAPKVAASQMIAALEPDPRGVYCGAIGHIAPHSHATFNVAIRTLTVESGVGHYFAGGGIVAESSAEREVLETRWKAAQMTRLLQGFPRDD